MELDEDGRGHNAPGIATRDGWSDSVERDERRDHRSAERALGLRDDGASLLGF